MEADNELLKKLKDKEKLSILIIGVFIVRACIQDGYSSSPVYGYLDGSGYSLVLYGDAIRS